MRFSQSSFAPRFVAPCLLGLAGLLAVGATGCRWHENGLEGGGPVAVEPAPAGLPPAVPGTGTPTPPVPTPADAAAVPKDAGGASDTTPVMPPVLPPSAPDAGATDAGMPTKPPVLPADAGPADTTPAPTPPTADQCAPGGGLLPGSVRMRFIRADDFTFDNEGRLLVMENRDIVQVGSSERDSLTLVRNVGSFQGVSTLHVLPDGDILVADSSSDHLLRVDPSARRPSRNEMTVRSPLKLAPVPGSRTAFYVTSQSGSIYLVDTATGLVRSSITLDFKPGGLAVDPTRRKLYVGAMGKSAVVAFTIGAQGELAGPVNVAEAVPQPTALAVDSCGGVFIAGGDGGAVRRIGLGGATTVVARLDARDVTTLEFGSGKHGWSEDSLFALDTFSGNLHEVRLKR